jgi:hypothetical protein
MARTCLAAATAVKAKVKNQLAVKTGQQHCRGTATKTGVEAEVQYTKQQKWDSIIQ